MPEQDKIFDSERERVRLVRPSVAAGHCHYSPRNFQSANRSPVDCRRSPTRYSVGLHSTSTGVGPRTNGQSPTGAGIVRGISEIFRTRH